MAGHPSRGSSAKTPARMANAAAFIAAFSTAYNPARPSWMKMLLDRAIFFISVREAAIRSPSRTLRGASMKRDGDGMHGARAKRRWLGAASLVALLAGAGPAWADNCFTASGNPFLMGFANGTSGRPIAARKTASPSSRLAPTAAQTSFFHDGCRHGERQCHPGAGLVPGKSRHQCRTASRPSSDCSL